jgi:hypothetical protein
MNSSDDHEQDGDEEHFLDDAVVFKIIFFGLCVLAGTVLWILFGVWLVEKLNLAI